ncbi:hypothetical protein OAL67_01100 [bacterium]|nr:hypothetical protein [bacterium]
MIMVDHSGPACRQAGYVCNFFWYNKIMKILLNIKPSGDFHSVAKDFMSEVLNRDYLKEEIRLGEVTTDGVVFLVDSNDFKKYYDYIFEIASSVLTDYESFKVTQIN